jgi:hypothetical protein
MEDADKVMKVKYARKLIFILLMFNVIEVRPYSIIFSRVKDIVN